jgi:hypothetical protein
LKMVQWPGTDKVHGGAFSRCAPWNAIISNCSDIWQSCGRPNRSFPIQATLIWRSLHFSQFIRRASIQV